MKYLILILVILLSGCASLNGTAKITETAKGVEFETSRPAKMTMEKDGATYTYDSQAPSIMSKIMGALTLGVVGTRR